jgi:MoaA/NifB/PqqE/SkfB family radical SAM enzyme
MFKFNELKQIHLEISSNCQASCPMCTRNIHGGLENELLSVSDWTANRFKTIINQEVLQQVESLYFCGNYGDPLLNKDLLEMIEYSVAERHDIDIRIHTNGSLRSKDWWTQLATILPEKHLVVFALDGLEDTHSLYRIGTDFDMIVRNARAFIAAGGKARWNFITFQHNEHQLESCRELAKEMGFESFHEKQTSRFIGSKEFKVFDRDGTVTHTLLPPGEQKIAFIDRKTVENYKEVIKTATISCQVEDERSIYIDAQGLLWPCCFLASVPYQYATPDKLVYNFMNDSTTSLLDAIKDFGGIDGLDLRKRSIEEIVNSTVWQSMWNKRFEDKSILMCARVCGKFPEAEVSQCRDQFLELREFNE